VFVNILFFVRQRFRRFHLLAAWQLARQVLGIYAIIPARITWFAAQLN
jgi:hypothetical protein